MAEYRFSERVDRAIVRFAADLAATLNLRNWTLGLSSSGPDDDETWGPGAFAQVEPVPHRHHASISVCDDFLRIGHREILMVLVHELCHLYLVEVRQAVQDQRQLQSMSAVEFNQFASRTFHEEEMAVDLMAIAWTDVMWEWESTHVGLRKITRQVERTAQ